jgi:photosystem II stability/assembly factor-like uncharacterized protein
MERTIRLGLILAMSALVGCGGGGGSTDDGGGGTTGSWGAARGGLLVQVSGTGEAVERNSHTTADLNSIFCVDSIHGWVAGAVGFLIRSIDGGATWDQHSTGTQANLRATAFADTNFGLAVGDGGTVVRTEDGGQTWKTVAIATQQNLYAVAIRSDRNLAVIVGDGGVILRSTDQAKSFSTPGAYDSPINWRSVKLSGDGKIAVLAGAGGELKISKDEGLSFADLPKAPNGLRGLSITTDASRIVAVGESGLIWKSTDSGQSFDRVESGTSSTLNAVGFALDNVQLGWIVGDSGTFLETRDGASKLNALKTPAPADFTSVEDF